MVRATAHYEAAGYDADVRDDRRVDPVPLPEDTRRLSVAYELAWPDSDELAEVEINPADLRIVGTYRSTATPFEMYLELRELLAELSALRPDRDPRLLVSLTTRLWPWSLR